MCNKAYGQCIKAHPDDALGQNSCKDDILSQCGDKDIAKFVGSPSGDNDDDDDDDEEADANTTSTATSGMATRTATTTGDESDAADSSATTTDAPAETTAAEGAAAKNGVSLALAAGVMAAFVYML